MKGRVQLRARHPDRKRRPPVRCGIGHFGVAQRGQRAAVQHLGVALPDAGGLNGAHRHADFGQGLHRVFRAAFARPRRDRRVDFLAVIGAGTRILVALGQVLAP